jgi:electron transfer flavoprotein beta subunit
MEKNIIVCVKQVPNTSNVSLDPKHHTLIREGIDNILNPHDEIAIHTALECKKKYGFRTAVVTMGPPQAKSILVDCLRMGVDEAYLLTDGGLAGSDTLATSRALSALIKKIGYVNIFCGQESIDSSTGHIGPSLAELLGLPQIIYAEKILQVKDNKIRVRVESIEGYKLIEAQLPVLISFNKSPKKIIFKHDEIDETKIKQFSLGDLPLDKKLLGVAGSPTWVTDISIDESVLNFLRVDSRLSAEERIRLILTGGIEENKERVILRGHSKAVLDKLIKTIAS